MLTASASDLAEILPFTLPVDIVCHEEAYLVAAVGLPFVTNPDIAIVIAASMVGSRAEVQDNGQEKGDLGDEVEHFEDGVCINRWTGGDGVHAQPRDRAEGLY